MVPPLLKGRAAILTAAHVSLLTVRRNGSSAALGYHRP
jgi:hypothetical protein